MDGFKFFKRHQALKLHFTSKYDVMKYSGKVPGISEDKFYVRRDYKIFEQAARKCKDDRMAGILCVENFMKENDWVHGPFDVAIDRYNNRMEIRKDLTKYIRDDINVLNEIAETKKVTFNDLFQKTPSGNKPPALQLYMSDKILPDTLLSVDSVLSGTIDKWVEEYKSDPLVSDVLFKLVKFSPFAKIINIQE